MAFVDNTIKEYLDNLSSDAPTPGGGSVSAYVGSLGMGLSQMVIRIALKRKKKKDLTPEENAKDDARRETLQKIESSLEENKGKAFEIVDSDPKIYEEVMAAWGDGSKMEETLHRSFQLQADLAGLIVQAYEWNEELKGLVSGSVKNDLFVSEELLRGAFQGAHHTAMINVKYMKDENKKTVAEAVLNDYKEKLEHANVTTNG